MKFVFTSRLLALIATALLVSSGPLPVLAQAVDGPPVILSQPAGQSVVTGSDVVFGTEAEGLSPFRFQWRVNGTNISTATNATLVITNVQSRHWGVYSVVVSNSLGSATSAGASLIVDADLVFQILALQTNAGVAIEHNSLTGDDRGGIAVSPVNVFVTGDGTGSSPATGRFPIDTLTGGGIAPRFYDALTSNLRTETVYTLGNGASPIQYQNFTLSATTVNSLIAIDGVTGDLTATRINLSTNIPISNSSGIFAGYDRIVIYNNTSSRAYNISLPSGLVTDLGNIGGLTRNSSESWAFWGVAEYFAGSIHLLYGANTSVNGVFGSTVTRLRLSDRSVSYPLGPIPNGLGDMASFTFSLSRSRWFFHLEGSSIFRSPSSNPDETVGSAKAAFTTEAAYQIGRAHV